MSEYEQAIDWLTEKGYEARYRKWALGESVVVGEAVVTQESGIQTLNRMHYLYKDGDVWAVTNFNPEVATESEAQLKFSLLSEALNNLDRIMKSK